MKTKMEHVTETTTTEDLVKDLENEITRAKRELDDRKSSMILHESAFNNIFGTTANLERVYIEIQKIQCDNFDEMLMFLKTINRMVPSASCADISIDMTRTIMATVSDVRRKYCTAHTYYHRSIMMRTASASNVVGKKIAGIVYDVSRIGCDDRDDYRIDDIFNDIYDRTLALIIEYRSKKGVSNEEILGITESVVAFIKVLNMLRIEQKRTRMNWVMQRN